MPLTSDLTLDGRKFASEAISKKTKDLNDKLMAMMANGPEWHEVGAPEYRRMRWEGETTMPKPAVLPQGKNVTIPSWDHGRSIPCRLFEPERESRGVFMHIHGGGWVLQSESFQDELVEFIANATGLTTISVGYRLAPEHQYPAGPDDCYDAAEWLVDNAQKVYGGPLMMAGGESAGAHLTSLTTLHLLRARPHHSFKGLLLSYGVYDLASCMPSTINDTTAPILTPSIMTKYITAFLPDHKTAEARRDASISPFYADFRKSLADATKARGVSESELKLPPALFAVGSVDCLVDDSVMMCTKWAMSGARAVLKVYPGAPHNFTLLGVDSSEGSAAWREDVREFVDELGL